MNKIVEKKFGNESFNQPSASIQEIVAQKPDFLTSYGNYFLLGVLVIITLVSWYVRYPEVVNSKAKLTSINAPKPVISLQQGKLIKLFVRESQRVHKGEILGWIESVGSHEEIQALNSDVDSLRFKIQSGRAISFHKWNHKLLRLGELQPAYQTFMQALLSYKDFQQNGLFEKKKTLLEKEIKNFERLRLVLLQQKKLQEQDLNLTQKTYEANETLNSQKVLSDFDFRSEQGKLIGKKLTLPQTNSAIINNENQISIKLREQIELNNDFEQQFIMFSQSLALFTSQLDDWKRKYLLSAPIDGSVAFASLIQENQELALNQVLFYINPENSQYFAEVIIPQANFGKVSIGQKVLLKFDSYPFQEYGFVLGKIESINNIPVEAGYVSMVSLPKGLVTNRNIKIQYRSGLTAQSEIVTNNSSLLEKVYNTVYSSLNKF